MPFIIKIKEECVWCQGHGDRCDKCNETGFSWNRFGAQYSSREYANDILRMMPLNDSDKLVAFVEEER